MIRSLLGFGFAGLLTTIPDIAVSCPSCFGAPDAPATHGLNMAIFALLGVTGGVMAGFFSLFLGIRKRTRLLQGSIREEAEG